MVWTWDLVQDFLREGARKEGGEGRNKRKSRRAEGGAQYHRKSLPEESCITRSQEPCSKEAGTADLDFDSSPPIHEDAKRPKIKKHVI